jgi:hypothetical protein
MVFGSKGWAGRHEGFDIMDEATGSASLRRVRVDLDMAKDSTSGFTNRTHFDLEAGRLP